MCASFDSVRVISLQTRSLQEITKLCWGDFVLIWPTTDASFVDGPDEDEKIEDHRVNVVDRISETFTEATLPKKIKDQLVDAVIHFQRGYLEALLLIPTHRNLYHLDTSFLLKGGRFGAKHFINPTTGYFDELAWANRVCLDVNSPEFNRFELACYYCLEERLKALWCCPTVKRRYAELRFRHIAQHQGFFVAVWVYWLGNKLDQVMQLEGVFADGFYAGCVRKALEEHNEHASRFFWARGSDEEKAVLMVGISGYYLRDGHLAALAESHCTGIVHFIYSLLSTEDKRNLISYGIKYEDCNVWCCLLSSPFYESVLRDLQTLPFPTENKTYVQLIDRFTSQMVEFPLSLHKKIFRVLWKPLSQGQREELLEKYENFLERLMDLEDIDLLETVVQSFSPAVKDRMLLTDWRRSGMSYLGRLYETDHKHAVLRYLRLFLVDRDPVTNRWLLRKDAADLIDRFSRKFSFPHRTDGEIPELIKPEFDKVIDNLRGSLSVLHHLLDRVEEEIHGDGTEFLQPPKKKSKREN